MSPADIQRETDYGSVYSSVDVAKAALAQDTHDPKAHRTLARAYAEQVYKNPEYTSCPPAQITSVSRRLTVPVIAEDRAALVADPANPVTKMNLAAAYEASGEYKDAIYLWEQVTAYPPEAEGAKIALKDCQDRLAQETAGH